MSTMKKKPVGKTPRKTPRSSQRAIEGLKIQLEGAVDAKEKSRLQHAINAIKGAQTRKNRMIERKKEMNNAKAAAIRANNEFGVLSPEKQQRAIELIPRLPSEPEAFEEFSTLPLETQLEGFASLELGGGGQKGGGPSEVIKGAVKLYITPAWVKARDSSSDAKNYVSDIALKYINKIKTLVAGAGLSGPNARQNLKFIVYGVAVLGAAWNLSLIQMIPGVTFQLIRILSFIATKAGALLASSMLQDVVSKMTAAVVVYRYQDIPVGAYGVVSSTVAPIFTALYARGDQAFQAAFPQFGENIAAGGAARLQELKKLLKDTLEMSKAKLQEAAAATQPGIAAIKGLGAAWRTYLNNSIDKLMDGLTQVKNDADKIRVYYKFLEDAGKQAQEMREPIVIQDEVAAAEIAGLIPPTIHVEPDNIGNLLAGAVAIGDIINDENPIVDDDEAAALLLALGNIAPENTDFAPANMVVNNNNAAAPEETNVRISDIGGKARRRRHRKTAKKSHKKRHTKKHKRKSTKGKNGKRGKKSKRHTKRRSYKVGAHSPYH